MSVAYIDAAIAFAQRLMMLRLLVRDVEPEPDAVPRARRPCRELEQLEAAARDVCAWVLGAPPSGPLLADLQKIPAELGELTGLATYHGASSALSAVVSRYPELNLEGLAGEISSGPPCSAAVVLARKLEPIAGKITQGLPFVTMRDVHRV